MAKTQNTKRALLSSVLALVLCVSMLIGSTFAWFTDSVTSTGNIIKSGALDIEMMWADGKEDPSAADWKDASEGAIFKNDLWEPGYTEVRHIKISNEGTLALKYQLSIAASGEVSALADVIDVYYIDGGKQIADRAALADEKSMSNLTNALANVPTTANGSLAAGEEIIVTIALKMQESAGNEYQDLAIGSDFSVILFATQMTAEKDSFDDQYDANAPEMYTVNGVAYATAAEALAAAKDGDKVYLSSVTEPIVIDQKVEVTIANANIVAGEGVNAITVNADATIVVEGYNTVTGGKGADGIFVADGVALTVTGNGNLVAVGNAGAEDSSKIGGSGIDVKGTIVITDLAGLSAKGYGWHAFGIGGTTKSIIIKNAVVNYAKGGMVKTAIEDKNYGKNEPEAGAAIGSETDGAVIDIEGSIIKKAEGGSKAAGIGAMYHTGVTVNITDSTVTAFGGTSSAGIGGSRVTKHESAEAQAINITIENSTINATGGDFAAGIGSGYNTYCSAARPVISVTIDAASDITAQGGLLGAGVGTGHNVIDFVGNIACDTANIKAGSSEDPDWCCWGNPCTEAQDVGVGVLSINNFKNDYALAATAEDMVAALESGGDVMLTESVKIDPASLSNAYGKTGINVKNGQTIDGNGNTVDIKGAGGTWDSGINTTGGIIRNITVTGSFRGIFVNHNSTHSEPVVLQNVTIDGTVYTISCDQGMNQTLIASNSTFNGWTSYAATLGSATFNFCSFGEGRGYAYMRPYAPTTYVNCDFAEGYEIDARAAVTFENCTIGGVALTAENLSTLVTSNIANATVIG